MHKVSALNSKVILKEAPLDNDSRIKCQKFVHSEDISHRKRLL